MRPLNDAAIRRLGIGARFALEHSVRPFALAYEPGNGTRYDLALVPLERSAPADDYGGVAFSLFADRPHWRLAVLVAWVGHGAWAFELLAADAAEMLPHPVYVAEKFDDCTLGDAEALLALFQAVAVAVPWRA